MTDRQTEWLTERSSNKWLLRIKGLVGIANWYNQRYHCLQINYFYQSYKMIIHGSQKVRGHRQTPELELILPTHWPPLRWHDLVASHHEQWPLHQDFPFPCGHSSHESALWLPQLTEVSANNPMIVLNKQPVYMELILRPA